MPFPTFFERGINLFSILIKDIVVGAGAPLLPTGREDEGRDHGSIGCCEVLQGSQDAKCIVSGV